MLGDFNLVEDSLDRLPCHMDDPNAVAALGNLKANFDLVDGWRRTNPDKRAYTHQHAPNASQGRIDRIYISNELLHPATEWQITNSPIETDHWIVTLGARGGIPGWYTANTLQGHGQSTHYIPTWALKVHS